MTKREDAPCHERPADKERQLHEEALDKTIEASFPASDPPSTDPDPVSSEDRDEPGQPCGEEPG